MDRIFKPGEVDALIPKLESVITHMLATHERVQDLAHSRPRLGNSPSPAQVAESARIRSQIEFLLGAVQEDVESIGRLGGIVKDLFMGLVDFPGVVDGEDVWLCWKRGEKKVRYWHPLNAGFSERRPLERWELWPGHNVLKGNYDRSHGTPGSQ